MKACQFTLFLNFFLCCLVLFQISDFRCHVVSYSVAVKFYGLSTFLVTLYFVDDDEDDDDDIDLDFSDAPERPASEAIKDYFERTKEYWLSKAQEYCDAEDMKLSAKKLEKLAKEMCQEAF